jgi:hypothetical protein
MNAAHSPAAVRAHRGSAGYFLRHLGEMALAMLVGMAAGGAVLMVLAGTVLAPTIGGLTHDEVLARFAVLITLVLAVSTSATMAAWMRYRGMAWRLVAEMAAAMFVPLVPIYGLVWVRVIPGAMACGLYCVAMWPAMVVAMLFRRGEYSAGHGQHGRVQSATS